MGYVFQPINNEEPTEDVVYKHSDTYDLFVEPSVHIRALGKRKISPYASTGVSLRTVKEIVPNVDSQIALKSVSSGSHWSLLIGGGLDLRLHDNVQLNAEFSTTNLQNLTQIHRKVISEGYEENEETQQFLDDLCRWLNETIEG